MYTDADSTRRFLVADEVGLGKTMVAKGVVARAIDHLWDTTDRIDIVYICSNSSIARQNLNRLNVTSATGFEHASRITLLPLKSRDFTSSKLNLFSFTPGTSFELRSSLGTVEERALLHELLRRAWSISGRGPAKLLQGNVASLEVFERCIASTQAQSLDEDVARAFADALARRPKLRDEFKSLADRFGHVKNRPATEIAQRRNALVGDLRMLLATTCLSSLEPDLIILDEFQRFKHLLDGTDAASELARGLFEYEDANTKARVLLISATPYKMYTLDDETEAGDDHYADFLRTVSFLEDDESKNASFKQILGEYRRELLHVGSGGVDVLMKRKTELEARLRRVMVRTERLAVSADRGGMLSLCECSSALLAARDVAAYASIDRISEILDQHDTLEYWKSAPYLLNFMDGADGGYKLKGSFTEACSDPGHGAEIARVIGADGTSLLDWQSILAYRKVDPANARLRGLLADTVEKGAWRLLWIPPSLPYYAPHGPFADEAIRTFTKRLIFSSWQVVPKAIACMTSYAVERELVDLDGEETTYTDERRGRTRLLRFYESEGRLTGLPLLSLVYPCRSLARECDPRRLPTQSNGETPSREAALEWARKRVDRLLKRLDSRRSTGPSDEAWYWAAPILLDLLDDPEATCGWFTRLDLAETWSGSDDSEEGDESRHWVTHVMRARDLVCRDGGPRVGSDGMPEMAASLGPRPADLSEFLAEVALAAPATCALRALGRVCGDGSFTDSALGDAAARVGKTFLNVFNGPEATTLLNGLSRGWRREVDGTADRAGLSHEEPYWRRVLDYCLDGNLQAMFDEYAHILRDSLGLRDQPVSRAAAGIAEKMCESLGLRTATLRVDDVRLDAKGTVVSIANRRMRVRFALRFGDDRAEDEKSGNRRELVQGAFNSPFWPFVLATTSIGQEGLDFHHYCHAVVHWNLPANPVDLEQREGRVHRYKGHAVRRNLATKLGGNALADRAADPWEALFREGELGRGKANDLVPYWVYPLAGGAVIERHVPALPLSRDRARLASLGRSLAAYRLVFGQPRQEDLVAYLTENMPADRLAALGGDLRIDLSPPRIR